jgi:hypothetical protein
MTNSETPNPDNSSLEIRNSKFEPHWNRLYAIVIGELALTILIFYIFTKLFE